MPGTSPSVVAGNTVVNPTKVRGQTMRWLGCVDVPVDTPGQTSFPAANPPSEINPDASPTGASRWRPQMQDLTYRRNNSNWNAATYTTNGDDWTNAPGYGSDPTAASSDNLMKSGAMACGKPAKRLGEMTRSEVSSWVHAADFAPVGGTYHDTGMIWGARLISPTGPWAADTAAWSGRSAPNRVIIFLTDGDMSPSSSSYSMYGLEGYERRVTSTALTGDPSSGKTGSPATCTVTTANCWKYMTYHNNRFLGACAAAKAKNIDVWTVAIDTASSTELQTCATTTNQAKYTTSGTDLGTIFADIARRLAMLRLSQ